MVDITGHSIWTGPLSLHPLAIDIRRHIAPPGHRRKNGFRFVPIDSALQFYKNAVREVLVGIDWLKFKSVCFVS